MGLIVEVNWEEIACLGIRDLKNYKVLTRQLLAEFIGTFVYIFIGCCSIVSHDYANTKLQASWIVFGLAFGLGLHCSIIFAGHISNHFNPAVTVGMFIIGECSILRGLPYIMTQLMAGVTAVGVIVLISPADDTENSGYASCFINLSPVGKGIIPEALGVFLLILTISVVLDTSRKDVKGSPALAIGICVAAANMHCYYWTGASFNPARTMGTAIFSDMWDSTWVYWFAPILGTSIAGLTYRFIFAFSGFPPEETGPKKTKEEKQKEKEEMKLAKQAEKEEKQREKEQKQREKEQKQKEKEQKQREKDEEKNEIKRRLTEKKEQAKQAKKGEKKTTGRPREVVKKPVIKKKK